MYESQEEQDNEGCYYIGGDTEFRPTELTDQPRESCECELKWDVDEPTVCGQVLEAYVVKFVRKRPVI